MKKKKINKDKIKAMIKASFPESRFFYVLLTLNVLNFILSITSGEYNRAMWVFMATLWMWGFYLSKTLTDEMHDFIHELIETNQKNTEETLRMMKFLEKQGVGKLKIVDEKLKN